MNPLTKLFGTSWEGKIASAILVVSTVPLILTGAGMIVPAWLIVAGGICGSISTAFGLAKQKSDDVTGSGSGAVKGQNVSNV